MRQTKFKMGMPVTVEIVEPVTKEIFNEIFSYFDYVDQKFSTYKQSLPSVDGKKTSREASEISLFNEGKLKRKDFSKDMKKIFKLAEKTKQETNGYFDIFHDGKFDPSGVVKGWAIFEASKILKKTGVKNFYINVGDDIQFSGKNAKGNKWTIGIKNPFKQDEIVKVIHINNQGVATSGTYIRGAHIYNPKGKDQEQIVSLTVIGPNVYEADRFATAAFVMGKEGVNFIENLEGFEGYMIDKEGIATMTSGFKKYTIN